MIEVRGELEFCIVKMCSQLHLFYRKQRHSSCQQSVMKRRFLPFYGLKDVQL